MDYETGLFNDSTLKQKLIPKKCFWKHLIPLNGNILFDATDFLEESFRFSFESVIDGFVGMHYRSNNIYLRAWIIGNKIKFSFPPSPFKDRSTEFAIRIAARLPIQYNPGIYDYREGEFIHD